MLQPETPIYLILTCLLCPLARIDSTNPLVYNLLHMSTSELTQTQESQATAYPDAASQEMIDAGVFYGRKKNRTHPKMRQFVLTNRSGIEIINLEKTAEYLEKALSFIKEKVRNGGSILVVGTEPEAEEAIRGLAERFKLSYVTNRWAGGTLTNFKIISKRIEYFKKLVSDMAKGALEKYTKKERLGIEREINRLRYLFGGLENFEKLPDAVLIINAHVHDSAVREAWILKIPVIALANINTNPAKIGYLVPGNDKSRKSIQFFLNKVADAIAGGIATRPVVEEKKAEETPATAVSKKNDK